MTPPVDASERQFSQDVTIGDGTPELLIAIGSVLAGFTDFTTSDADSQLDAYASPIGVALFEPPPDSRSVSSGAVTSSLSATQIASNSWSATVSTNWILTPDPKDSTKVGRLDDGNVSLWFKFTNPQNRDNDQSVHVQVKPDPSCSGGFVSGVRATDINGNSKSLGCPAPMPCALSDTPPSFSFDDTGSVLGDINVQVNRGNNVNPGQSGACTVTVNVQPNQ